MASNHSRLCSIFNFNIYHTRGEMMKYNSELKLAIEAHHDNTADGSATRFTFGEVGDAISGAVYFKKDEPIPQMLIIMIYPPAGAVLIPLEEPLEKDKI